MSKHAIRFDHKKDRTKQSFKDECDINKIMAKFQKTGAITHFASHGAYYGETTGEQLADAMNIVANANSMFEELPAELRKKFKNDPEVFLEYVQDPKNLEEMREIGLANPNSALSSQPEPTSTQSDQPSGSTGKTDNAEDKDVQTS